MSSPAAQRMTPEQYLALERSSELKHEFYDGQIFAIAGTSRRHNTICFNLARELGNSLRGGPCQPFGMDMRTKLEIEGLYTYPDVIVVCGEPLFEDGELDTLLNPAVVVEVLSPSTERYDRGKKFAMYASVPTLSDYLLVSQDEVRVEHYVREGANDWHLSICSQLDATVRIASIGCDIALREIYDRVQFGPAKPLHDQTG